MNAPSPPLLLGIDAGGTSVDAVLAEPDGTVIGTGRAGAGNPMAMPLETVTGHLAEAVKNAIAEADPARVASAVLGVAGVARFVREDGAAALRRVWRECGLRCEARVVADPVVAFAAGTPARRGAVLIGGTGTIAAAIDDAEVTSRVDGHGWLVGDDGSGFWLGRQAVRAVLSELDGRGEPTILRNAVLATLTGCDELPSSAAEQLDLLRAAVYEAPPIGLARLAALVPAAADAGDRVAQRIVDRAVALLIDTVEALLAGGPVAVPASGRAGCTEGGRASGTDGGPAGGSASGSAGGTHGGSAGGSASGSVGGSGDGRTGGSGDGRAGGSGDGGAGGSGDGGAGGSAGWRGGRTEFEERRRPLRPSSPLVLAGSVVASAGPIQREVRRRITARYGSAPLIAGSGAGGAAWLAARQLRSLGPGAVPCEEVHARLTAAAATRA